MFKLASLFVEIKARDDALKKQLDGVPKQLNSLGVAIGTAVGQLAAGAIATAGSALTGFFARGIAGASNLAETVSKVESIFGEASGGVTSLAEQLSTDFGLSKQAILDAEAAIGLVGKSAGQSQSEAAGMSAQMAKLAADASSFYNVPLDDALNKIRSGLVGEAEPLRAFGVLLSEEAVAAEAVALGLAKSTKEVDNQAKVAARASLITKGLADASGDLERTQNSTANQYRKLTGTIENLAVSLGGTLAPAVNSIINLANDMAQSLVSDIESSKSMFESFAEAVADNVDAISFAWRNLPELWEVVQIKAREMGQNLLATVAVLPENFMRIASYIGRNWKELILDGINATITAFKNFGENLGNLTSAIIDWFSNPTGGFNFEWKPLLDGFEATAEKLPELLQPELVSMQDEIDAVYNRIADRESERADQIAAKAKETAAEAAKTGQAIANGTAAKEASFQSQTVGAADFAGRLRSAALSGKEDVAEQQLDQQKKIAKSTEEMASFMNKPQVAVLGG